MESYHTYALFKIPDLGYIQCGSNMPISLACLASACQASWEVEVSTAAISRGAIGPACAGIFSSPSVYLSAEQLLLWIVLRMARERLRLIRQ